MTARGARKRWEGYREVADNSCGVPEARVKAAQQSTEAQEAESINPLIPSGFDDAQHDTLDVTAVVTPS